MRYVLARKFFKQIYTFIQPYARVLAWLVTNRTVMSMTQVRNFNQKMLTLSKEQVFDRKTVQDLTFYALVMNMKQFRELCNLVNISYFIRATSVRMFVTVFIIILSFLGTSIFSTGLCDCSAFILNKLLTFKDGGVFATSTLKVITSGLLPLIPQLVSIISSTSTDMEKAVFNARLTNSCRLMELKYNDKTLVEGLEPKFIILNVKPAKKLRQKEEQNKAKQE